MLRTQGWAGGKRTFLPLRNNPGPTGNRSLTVKKPATERTLAQGVSESEEVSFSDQNCKGALFSLSDRIVRFPGPVPTVECLTMANNRPEGPLPGVKRDRNPFKTGLKRGIPGFSPRV